MNTKGPRILRTPFNEPPACQRKFGPDVVWLEIKHLRLHPSQDKYFTDTTAAEQDAFAANIAEVGLNDELGVLVNNEIIDGRRRFNAVKSLGWERVACLVRQDLANADPWKIELELIKANEHRRHLTKLQRVALAFQKHSLELQDPNYRYQGEVRDKIGKILGMSGRQVDRYQDILKLPREFQAAVDDKTLTMDLGKKVLNLSSAAQTALLERVAEGVPMADAVREATEAGAPARRRQAVHRQIYKVDRWLNAGLQLAPDTDFLASNTSKSWQPKLEQVQNLVAALLQSLAAQSQPRNPVVENANGARIVQLAPRARRKPK